MTRQMATAVALAAAIGLSGVSLTDTARADSIFSLMNPFNWFFGDDWDDDYYDHYRGGPHGWGAPYAWNARWWGPGYTTARPTVIVIEGVDPSQNDSAELASVHVPE